jgi:chorismate mutase/prephenate dehydratase
LLRRKTQAMTRATDTDVAPAPAEGAGALAVLRGEIDALDDALHDLLMRRAGVVARLAGSRAKTGASPLRPGREARVLRRLQDRHAGPLPFAAVVRLWRDLFAASTALQGPFAVAVCAGGEGMRLAREHFGLLTPLVEAPAPARALAMLASGEVPVAVLPAPEEGEPAGAAWWTALDSPRLQVSARLPFWSTGGAPGAEALVVTPGAPDPSGEDRSLLRLQGGVAESRTGLRGALADAGMPPRHLLLRRDGPAPLALAEVEGVVEAGDPRLAALRVDHVLPLGFYAVPLRGA